MSNVQDNFVRLTLAAKDENVAVARLTTAAVAAQLGFTLSEVEELKVAVSEAVTNSIIHGYGGDEQRLIELCLIADEEGLLLKVADEGVGIEDVPKALEPTWSSVAERMGLGFVFMQSFTDTLEVDSKPGQGTAVVMKKQCRA